MNYSYLIQLNVKHEVSQANHWKMFPSALICCHRPFPQQNAKFRSVGQSFWTNLTVVGLGPRSKIARKLQNIFGNLDSRQPQNMKMVANSRKHCQFANLRLPICKYFPMPKHLHLNSSAKSSSSVSSQTMQRTGFYGVLFQYPGVDVDVVKLKYNIYIYIYIIPCPYAEVSSDLQMDNKVHTQTGTTNSSRDKVL